jgi:hypothetical protein
VYTASVYEEAVRKPDLIELMVHDDGVNLPELDELYKNRVVHDPRDLNEARRLAEFGDRVRLGVFYKNEELPRYEDIRRLRTFTAEEKVKLLNEEFDRYAV